MKKVLISAFKPFYKSVNNYSFEVLNYINNECVDKKVIDVVYDECFKELSESGLDNYNLIIALGEARSRKILTFEKRALNLSSCSIADNKNNFKSNEVIDINCPEYLETSLDLEQLKEFGDVSYDAGKFVCNNMYFHLLKFDRTRTLFIHIPECNNDLELYKQYGEYIDKVIDILLKQLEG